MSDPKPETARECADRIARKHGARPATSYDELVAHITSALEEREREREAWRTDAGKSHLECDNLKSERDTLKEQLAEAVKWLSRCLEPTLIINDAWQARQFLTRAKCSTGKEEN